MTRIESWIEDVVNHARLSLPADHPRRISDWFRRADVYDRASGARDHRARRGKLPSAEEIQRLAEGGVDMVAVRAENELKRRRADLLAALDVEAPDAPIERLDAALAALRGKS